MGPICLSLAPILRCVSFTRLQSTVLLVPPGIEACICLILTFSEWSSTDMKRTLLAAEGLTYFLWTILDFLTHIVPAVRSTLLIYKTLDILLGSLSFAPLLLYTSFIFLVIHSELLQTIPLRLQTTTKCTLLALIPMIITANTLGSFVGVSYRNSPRDRPPSLVVGFLDSKAQFLWTFFSDLALALLVSFQVLSFLLFLCRAVNVIVDRKRVESEGDNLQNHELRGIPLMMAGSSLGVVETALGFADGGFGHTLARRVLRLLGRALLIAGFVKGWDSLENFQSTPGDTRRLGRLRGMPLISNPRCSTFRHVNGDPEFTMFEHHLRTSSLHPPPLTTYANIGAGSRVTVQFPRGRAPTLHIRLSDINFIPGDLEKEPPKTAPARIYGFTETEEFPPSPYTPPPFSNLIPIFKRRSVITVAKEVVSKARAQYHRYSHSGTFDTGNGLASQSHLLPVNFDGAINSPAQDSRSRARSRVSSGSGIWLGRHVNKQEPRSFLVPPDPNAGLQNKPQLTTRWTRTTECVSSVEGSQQLHNQQSDNASTEETVSQIRPRLSRSNNNDHSFPRTASASEDRTILYEHEYNQFGTRITGVAAPRRTTPEPRESSYTCRKSMVTYVESSEGEFESVGGEESLDH